MANKTEPFVPAKSQSPRKPTYLDNVLARLIVIVFLVSNLITIAFGCFGGWKELSKHVEHTEYNNAFSFFFRCMDSIAILCLNVLAIFVEALMLYGNFTKRPNFYYPFLIYEVIQTLITGVLSFLFFLGSRGDTHLTYDCLDPSAERIQESKDLAKFCFLLAVGFTLMTVFFFYFGVVIPTCSCRYLKTQKNN